MYISTVRLAFSSITLFPTLTMPAVSTGKVLVTGANGYIAVWVVRRLLEQGYSVRGTVRSESKGTHLKEIFKEYGDKLEIVVVEDITKVSNGCRFPTYE